FPLPSPAPGQPGQGQPGADAVVLLRPPSLERGRRRRAADPRGAGAALPRAPLHRDRAEAAVSPRGVVLHRGLLLLLRPLLRRAADRGTGRQARLPRAAPVLYPSPPGARRLVVGLPPLRLRQALGHVVRDPL